MKPQHFLLALFLAAFYGIYILYQPFLMTISIAMLLAISTANIQRRFEELSGSNLVAALFSSLLLAILFFAPLGYFLTTITMMLNHIDQNQLAMLYGNIINWVDNLPEELDFAKSYLQELTGSISLGDSAANAVKIAALGAIVPTF